ncbi:MAG: DUF2029 domain-containing protein [Anaerolineaceae bacterium]|nr:DUF2029 domain-containing protein [Anaerolineaceae bacterium]
MRVRKAVFIILILAGAVAALSFAVHSVLQKNIPGVDFFNYYSAGRALFIEGRSSYSPEVTETIQMGIYNRLAKPGEDQFAFVHPPYQLLLFLPFSYLSFDWAQAIWLSANIIFITLGILIVFPRAPKWLLFSVLFLYPFSFGLIMGTVAVFLGLLALLLYGFILGTERPTPTLQIVLGIALAWATCKPQFIWLYAILFAIIALKHKFWFFLASACCSFLAFLAVSFLLIPDWLPQLLENVTVYAQTNQSWPTLINFLLVMLPPQAARLASLGIFFVLFILLFYWTIRWWKGKFPLLSLLAWCGLLTYLVHPHSAPYEQITMILPLLFWVGQSARKNSKITIYWFGGILFYWLIFGLGRLPHPPRTVHDWPIFYYIPWIIWMVSRPANSLPVVQFLERRIPIHPRKSTPN